MQQTTPALTRPNTRSSSKNGVPLHEAKELFERDILPRMGKVINTAVASAFRSNQRGLENTLKDGLTQIGADLEELCEKKLKLFTDEANEQQKEMRRRDEKAARVLEEKVIKVMEQQHVELLTNKQYHKVVAVLQEKEQQKRELQSERYALEQENTKLRVEQKERGLRPDIEDLRQYL